MTQSTLPCCYHTTHYLVTQICSTVYKDPILEEKSLKLVLLYLQAEYSCASQSSCLSATGVLLDLASERLHWWSCPIGLAFTSHCRSTLRLRSSLSLQELNERTTPWPDGDIRMSLTEPLVEQKWFLPKHHLKYEAPTGEFPVENHIQQRQDYQSLNAPLKSIL